MSEFRNGHALIVGIANYPRIKKLPEIVLKDAKDLSSILSSPNHCGYREDNIRLLTDAQADADGIRDGFKWLSSACGSEDTALIFMSSHGGRVEYGPQIGTYLLPYDSDPHHLKKSSISGEELTELLHGIQAERLLGLFDFCYSGGTGEPKGKAKDFPLSKVGFDQNSYDQLAQGKGRVIMASSRSDEESFVYGAMGNSLFTYFLLNALKGKALSRGDGLIRVFDIFHYIADNVGIGGQQHPIFKASDVEANFPVALHQGGEKAVSGYRPESLAVERVNKRALREMIIKYFSSGDLELLCADIQQDLTSHNIELLVNLDIVGGENLRMQALNLISYMEHRGYLSYLIQAIRLARPGIACAI